MSPNYVVKMPRREFYATVDQIPGTSLPFGADAAILYNKDCIYFLAERAAYVHFMGNGGWQCGHGWPLTFNIHIVGSRQLLGSAEVFVMDGQTPPTFEVCLK